MFELVKPFSQRLAKKQAFIILTVIYIFFLPLIFLLFKLNQKKEKRGWVEWSMTTETIKDAQKQY